MPSSIVKTYAEKTGKSEKTIEKYWDKAKRLADSQENVDKEDEDRYYAYVTGILKNMLDIED